ncbi:MAG TPA: biotin carboxylase N-terminal domain-containing protein, partial [Acidimicrobiia bacterium]|nr:biotin carboxylase N-terminal domain-containing protein [Acidimicrobiia bacterium]
PGSTPSETYLDIDAVLGAAKQTGADAIHPGYGFLAENSEFARRTVDAGLTWIGPSPEAIEVMGSKLRSKTLVESAGVPTLRAIDLSGMDEGRAVNAAAELGYPVLVKASAGGGGKGMRIVADPAALPEAMEGARREAKSAFGDDTVFLERYLEGPRHIEIQVLGDGRGQVISLFERECSIQRRHQKIIEEAPSPAVDEDLRRRMGDTAVTAAGAIGYVGAGTVEFLFQRGEFFFLEMNTRLQVEHPVTEMITGLDLVRLQIEIADGAPIEIEPTISGHAIEARLYAEDPRNDFLPVTGTIQRFAVPDLPGLRVDSGVEDGSRVSVYYDPMLAKVIAHGATRDDAAETLSQALRRAVLHGPVTNRELLVRILDHEEFRLGAIDTHFLERHDPAYLGRPLADMETEFLSALAAALADQASERGRSRVLATIPSGWRNRPGQYQERTYRGDHGTHVIRYSVTGTPLVEGLGPLEITMCTPDRVDFSQDGLDLSFGVARYGEVRHVDSEQAPVRLVALPRFPSSEFVDSPGSLHAPMPGRVVRVEARVGDSVRAGQALVVLEAMKMEHTLRAPHDGTVSEIDCSSGDQVEAGAVLVVIGQPSTTG